MRRTWPLNLRSGNASTLMRAGMLETDGGRVDLVDRRGDIQAAVVDQVHRGRSRNAGRGGDGHLAELAGDLRDDAVEWCAQVGARQLRPHGREVALGLLHVGLRRAACYRARLRLRLCLVYALDADEALVLELTSALGVAAREIGRQAGLFGAQLGRTQLILGDALLRNQVIVPQLQQDLSRLTRSPSRTRSLAICPPDRGASFERRQAVTVAARVLATVRSTAPRSTVASTTLIGFGRDRYHTVPAMAAATAAKPSTLVRRIDSLRIGPAR